jgi:mRNA interferase MazF
MVRPHPRPVRRGEVWLAALDPTQGGEIRKTRPCLIVSPDDLNAHLSTCFVAPLTTGSHPAPFRIAVRFEDKEGLILPDRMRTLDRRRLVRRVGAVDAETLSATLAVMRELFAE